MAAQTITAMPEYSYSSVKRAIISLRDRMHSNNKPNFTHAEILRLFSDDRTYDICMEAMDVIAISAMPSVFEATWSRETSHLVRIQIALQGAGRPPIPKYPTVQRDKFPELTERMDDWADRATYISKGFARAWAVYSKLDKICANPSVLRYAWPAAPTLVLHAAETESHEPLKVKLRGLAEKMAEFRTPRVPPAIPPELREAARSSSATIAAASLVTYGSNPGDWPVHIEHKPPAGYHDDGKFEYSSL